MRASAFSSKKKKISPLLYYSSIMEPSSKRFRRRISSRIERIASAMWTTPEEESSSTITVEGFVSTWNLDIESGCVEQELSSNLSKDDRTRCCNSFQRYRKNGGDLDRRLPAALRASFGSLIFFSSLVFSDLYFHIGAMWIGNIFLHSTLKENLGSTLQSVRSFAKSIATTTLLFALPLSNLIRVVPPLAGQIMLPPITLFVSFLIMSCPWLTAPNLMVLVMYVAVAAPVRFETTWHQPLGYLASYFIGLLVALLMNLVPPHQPNTAGRQIQTKIDRLNKDFFLLFMEIRSYTFNTGQSPKVARAAGATIDVLVKRITPAIADMKKLLPAFQSELLPTPKNKTRIERLDRWIKHLDQASIHLKMLRTMLNKRYLGESDGNDPGTIDAEFETISARHVRHIIAYEVGSDYHHFINSLIGMVVNLNQYADPYSESSHMKNFGLEELLMPCQEAFARAIYKVKEQLENPSISSPTFGNRNEYNSKSSIPIYTHLARRMTAFYSLFSIAQGLLDFEKESRTSNKPRHGQQNANTLSFLALICQTCKEELYSSFKSLKVTWWDPKWKWRDEGSLRLAQKTAVGMFLASFWMSLPYLWNIASPFGFWPGLTVASVNLAKTGSSFHKATDRLVGTLFAGSFALILFDFFPGNKDYAKIPGIAFFTFCVIYMKTSDHTYQYTYAATSIGSMLYGSVNNDYNVLAYVPKRIQLIFIGVITFAFVEVFLFPRRSRDIVEKKTFQFFNQVNNFLKTASEFAKQMKSEEGNKGNNDTAPALESLLEAQKIMKKTAATLKAEVVSAIQEPYFGFNQRLNAQALNGLLAEISEAEVQSFLLVNSLKKTSTMLYTNNEEEEEEENIPSDEEEEEEREIHKPVPRKPIPTGHRISATGEVSAYFPSNSSKKTSPKQSSYKSSYYYTTTNKDDWIRGYFSMIDSASRQMQVCQSNLDEAYPDSHFRPQNGNTLNAILAAASFRDFHDTRFNIVREWSHDCDRLGFERSMDPRQLPALGITISFLLELCRHLEQAGLKMEWYIQSFPP